jgi:predicted outer membrane repeat protein
VVAFNRAEGGGGGLAVGGRLTVISSVLVGNRSLEDFGGGAYLFSEAQVDFNDVTFRSNRAAVAGGGLYLEPPLFPGSRNFRNVTFESNFAPAGPDCAGVGCPAN